jgi:hypothetical protein
VRQLVTALDFNAAPLANKPLLLASRFEKESDDKSPHSKACRLIGAFVLRNL